MYFLNFAPDFCKLKIEKYSTIYSIFCCCLVDLP